MAREGILKKRGNYPSLWKVFFTTSSGQTVSKTIDAGSIATNFSNAEFTDLADMDVPVSFDLRNNKAFNVSPLQEAGTEEVENLPNQINKFHNPYNFIPLAIPESEADGTIEQPWINTPVGHDRYVKSYWNGRIGITITTKTPLLLPDAANVVLGHNGHKSYPTRTDVNGKPLLPVTSLKGAFRSVYEGITNSRMAIFHGHDAPLARRMEAREGLTMIPARVSDNGQNIELLMGTTTSFPLLQRNGNWNIGGAMYGAWLPRYQVGNRGAIQYVGGGYPQHGDKVVCWLEKISRGFFSYWRVSQIALKTHENSLSKNAPAFWQGTSNHQQTHEEMKKVTGYVYISNQNIKGKHDERVFFQEDETAQEFRPVGELEVKWRQLILDYKKIHEKQIKQREDAGEQCNQYLGDDPGLTAWSHHICQPDVENLKPGDLCYARVIDGRTIQGLYPVMIARELADVAPETLLSGRLTAHLAPASNIDQLSPADRVFGWVGQKATGSHKSYKGQLRIRKIHCDTENAIEQLGNDGLPLAILSTPKPTQSRFYLGNETGQAQTSGELNKKQASYQDGKILRGRKIFTHHKHTVHPQVLEDGYWDADAALSEINQIQNPVAEDRYYREYLRSGGERDEQNRSILSWVKPKTQFSCDIDIINLSKEELGALLWMLSLEKDHFFRLGGGKPLGFGSAHISLTSLDLVNGEGKKQQYSSLRAGTADNENRIQADQTCKDFREVAKEAIEAFKTKILNLYRFNAEGRQVARNFDELPFIKSFCQAATGFGDGMPVHYPRQDKELLADIEHFNWFGDNEEGSKLSLPNLSEDTGLPYNPE